MAVFLFLAGCGERRLTALDPMGPQSQWIYDNMILSLYVMAIVIIVVFVLFFIVVIRFRHKEGDNEYPEQVHGSTKLEVAWTVIPLFLLAILAVPTVTGQFYLSNTGLEDAEAQEDVNEEELSEEELEELNDDVLQITATGHQFWWQFDYNHGDGFTAGNEVYVPVGEKVAFILEAEDVMHSFWFLHLQVRLITSLELKTTCGYKQMNQGFIKGNVLSFADLPTRSWTSG